MSIIFQILRGHGTIFPNFGSCHQTPEILKINKTYIVVRKTFSLAIVVGRVSKSVSLQAGVVLLVEGDPVEA